MKKKTKRITTIGVVCRFCCECVFISSCFIWWFFCRWFSISSVCWFRWDFSFGLQWFAHFYLVMIAFFFIPTIVCAAHRKILKHKKKKCNFQPQVDEESHNRHRLNTNWMRETRRTKTRNMLDAFFIVVEYELMLMVILWISSKSKLKIHREPFARFEWQLNEVCELRVSLIFSSE